MVVGVADEGEEGAVVEGAAVVDGDGEHFCCEGMLCEGEFED